MSGPQPVDQTVSNIFDGASIATTILRVRDVAHSVRWYREHFGLEPLYVGSDGPDQPIATFAIAGSVVTLWQLPADEARRRQDNERNSYFLVVVDQDPRALRRELQRRGVEVGEAQRSANNDFFWFYDPDDNRFEFARPIGSGVDTPT